MAENLILVDEQNRAVGRAEKWTVHQRGLLHRAFSIFLVDADGKLLLQRRSRTKYHSAGLWANSCCGHPHPGETTLAAARRRLTEELGAAASLHFGFRARYCTALPNGLIENEIVYVYFGAALRARNASTTARASSAFALNPEEVSAIACKTLPELRRDIEQHPKRYAYWLRFYMKNHYTAIRREVEAVRKSAA